MVLFSKHKQIIGVPALSGIRFLEDFFDYAHSTLQHKIIIDDSIENNIRS